jgi:hypothetical protein
MPEQNESASSMTNVLIIDDENQIRKIYNQEINKRRIGIEHVFGSLKTFKILAECYRNRGKRLGLRFNLIAGIYNLELSKK